MLGAALLLSAPARAADPADLETKLTVTIDGVEKTLSLEEAKAGAPHSIGQSRADRSGQHRLCARLWRERHAQHAVSGRLAVEIRGGGRRHASRRAEEARARRRRQRQAHLMEGAGQRLRQKPSRHLARLAEHDRGDRRAGLSRLCGRRAVAQPHADPLRRAARQLAAGHGDHPARQRYAYSGGSYEIAEALDGRHGAGAVPRSHG